MNISFSRDSLNAELKAKITGVVQILVLFPNCVQLIDESGKILALSSQDSRRLYNIAQTSICCQNVKDFPELYDCLADYLCQIKI